MSLTDAQVAEIAGMTTGTSLGGRARDLAREVQASRKLIAELRATNDCSADRLAAKANPASRTWTVRPAGFYEERISPL